MLAPQALPIRLERTWLIWSRTGSTILVLLVLALALVLVLMGVRSVPQGSPADR